MGIAILLTSIVPELKHCLPAKVFTGEFWHIVLDDRRGATPYLGQSATPSQ